MCDQSVTIECDPFACEVTRFVGKPFKFGPAIINWCCGLPAKRTFPIFDGHMNSLVLFQCKGFRGAQYTLLVDRLKMYHHGTINCTGCHCRRRSDPSLLRPFDDQLPNNRSTRFLEPIRANWLQEPCNPLPANSASNRVKAAPLMTTSLREHRRPHSP